MLVRNIIMSLLILSASPVWAGERWQVVVLGQASDSLAPNHPAYQRVEKAIIASLGNADFDVMVKSQADMQLPCATVVCSGMNEAQLIEIAKKASKPVDMLLVYSVAISQQQGPATQKFQAHVPISLINLENDSRFFSRDKAKSPWTAKPNNLSAQAFENWIAQLAVDTAASAYTPIIYALEGVKRRFLYHIEFKKIVTSKSPALYEGLQQIPGFVSDGLTLKRELGSESQFFHTLSTVIYDYRSELDGAGLRNEMLSVFQRIGLDVKVQYQKQKRTFIISHVNMPYLAYYLGALLGLLLLLYLMYLLLVQSKHETVLRRHYDAHQARQGMAYLDQLQLILVPRKAKWEHWYLGWKKAHSQAVKLHAEAKALALSGRYDEAKEMLQQAIALNADCAEATALLEAVARYVRGEQLYTIAEAEWHADAAAAAHHLAEVKQLNPLINDKVNALEDKVHHSMRHGLVEQALTESAKALQSKRPYLALASVDNALTKIHGLGKFIAAQAQLKQQREAAIKQLTLITGAVSASGAFTGMHFIVADQVPIGRSKIPVENAITFGFKRLSKVGKQCRIERRLGQFSLHHGASSNGTFLDEQLLQQGQVVSLAHSTCIISMGGEAAPGEKKGQCQLFLHQPPLAAGSLVVTLQTSALNLVDQKALSNSWLGLAADLQKTWVLLGASLHVGINPAGRLCIVVDETIKALFVLGFRDYYTIAPVADCAAEVSVAGAPLVAQVPLAIDCKIAVNDLSFELHPMASNCETTS